MEIKEFFNAQDITSAIIWLIIVMLLTGFQRSRMKPQSVNRFFQIQVYFHIGMALFFAIFYLFYYGGGDTVAYWDGGVALHNLFLDSPVACLSEMWNAPDIFKISKNFNSITGYPPSWIYKEPESYFICKIIFPVSLITFRSYLAATIIIGYCTSLATWKFFCAVKSLGIHNEKWLVFGLLFLPSVAFWCSGISKDTFVYIAVCILVRQFLLIYKDNGSNKFTHFLWIVITLFLILQSRVYVLVALIPSFFVSISIWLNNRAKTNNLKKFAIHIFFYGLGIGVIILFIKFKTFDNIIEEIVIIQKDFNFNTTYGTNRYDLNITDYSTMGIIQTIPAALLAALYRPFPWESFNALLIMNGIENFFLLFLSVKFLTKGFWLKMQLINKTPILTFSFIFVLIMGFSVGFSSGLFGVLVRFKAIILPFFIILLTIKPNQPEKIEEAQEE
jgi:hypothetical protein